MRSSLKILAVGALAIAGFATPWLAGSGVMKAADHFDPPQRVDPAATNTPDIAADIADLYMYQTDTSLIVAIDFAGPRPTSEPARYDRDVLYTVYLSNAGARTDAEHTIEIRFGQDVANPAASGVRVTGIPGTTGPVAGPVESTLTSNGVRVFAGLIDDPFNFDAVGLRLSRESGSLMFDNKRNRFGQMNTTAVVIEIPLSAIRNGTNPIAAWSEAARIIPA